MNIYIETFLLQNSLINYCLLRLVELTTKSKTSIFRLIIASILGSVFSVIIAIFLNNNLIINIFKIICAFIMIKVAFRVKIKSFIYNFILLFIYTYALGGAVMALTGSVYTTNAGIVMSSKVSLEVICLTLIAVTYIFELVAKHIKQKITYGRLIYQLTLYLGNKHIKINGFLDTGNMLKYDGESVVVIDFPSYIKLVDTNLINYSLTNTQSVKTGTVNGIQNLKIIKLDKLKIKNGKKTKIIPNQYVAITNKIKADNYSALISPNLI